ncbi:MAG TPA: protein-glutamate O-methyltransferase [Candidatus Cybelea sp.]|nr:protein-glutamate O-methyltransferase [Candidatus Cybelea sp.]
MTPADFELLSGLVRQRSGLVLTKEKVYLLESRLVPLARRRGMGGLEALIAQVRQGRDEGLMRDITEAMTTNESFFFRDQKPFDVFRTETLPALLQSRAAKKQIRIWSAACSTGQEPYTLAMILKDEAARLAGWRIEIMATDLSAEVLEKAKVGLYSQFEVQRGLPIQALMKHFIQANEMWQIEASLRAMVKFREFNLLDDPGPLGQFDVIFCRNVLIYFDQETKRTVLERMSKIMPPDGVLYLGGAETVLGVSERFKPMQGQRGVYATAA